jgi:AhpD family alkylhydroperoxidase
MPDFWQQMEAAKPELTAKATGLRDHVFSDGALPRKTKELIYLGMCCATRFHDGIRIHAQRALAHGATTDEVYEAIALSIVCAGIPAFREAVNTVRQLIWPTEKPSGARR